MDDDVQTDVLPATMLRLRKFGGAEQLPALLRYAADLIEHGNVDVVALDYQGEHATEYGGVLTLVTRRTQGR